MIKDQGQLYRSVGSPLDRDQNWFCVQILTLYQLATWAWANRLRKPRPRLGPNTCALTFSRTFSRFCSLSLWTSKHHTWPKFPARIKKYVLSSWDSKWIVLWVTRGFLCIYIGSPCECCSLITFCNSCVFEDMEPTPHRTTLKKTQNWSECSVLMGLGPWSLSSYGLVPEAQYIFEETRFSLTSGNSLICHFIIVLHGTF